MPGARLDGVKGEAVLLASQQAHYSKRSVAAWLGIGERGVVDIPSHPDNDVRLDLLEEAARRAIEKGQRIACILATMGTTDAFGVDDLEGIVAMRDRLVEDLGLDYRPHVHADAVIGWAWSVFNDYDFTQNPLGFRPRTVRALAGVQRRMSRLHLADSVGIDFHKTGFCPYISSLFLVRDREDLKLIARPRESMPYLFQTGEHHPGVYTLETTRSGTGVLAALGNLLLLGKNGLRALLGHLVEMAEVLREHLEGHSATTVLNGENFGTVTLFRVYPDGVDTWSVPQKERSDPSYREKLLEYNEYNRAVYRYVHAEAMKGRGVLISLTENYRRTDYGEPMVALKSFITSPFADEENVELVVTKVLEAREQVE
jgi:glutamate/tyrosine decarboxylase-like PLP-dependent enzyme